MIGIEVVAVVEEEGFGHFAGAGVDGLVALEDRSGRNCAQDVLGGIDVEVPEQRPVVGRRARVTVVVLPVEVAMGAIAVPGAAGFRAGGLIYLVEVNVIGHGRVWTIAARVIPTPGVHSRGQEVVRTIVALHLLFATSELVFVVTPGRVEAVLGVMPRGVRSRYGGKASELVYRVIAVAVISRRSGIRNRGAGRGANARVNDSLGHGRSGPNTFGRPRWDAGIGHRHRGAVAVLDLREERPILIELDSSRVFVINGVVLIGERGCS